tara:strand:+ start:307 stop:603 length:297 start_codon:yes stop_codon:yes gene_type:complete
MSNIGISIDVTLLDKKRFKELTRKNGQRAVFADLILVHTPDGQYGDYMVKQSVTKEEREARIEMPILGNGKTIGTQSAKPKPQAQQPTPEAANDDVPF